MERHTPPPIHIQPHEVNAAPEPTVGFFEILDDVDGGFDPCVLGLVAGLIELGVIRFTQASEHDVGAYHSTID